MQTILRISVSTLECKDTVCTFASHYQLTWVFYHCRPCQSLLSLKDRFQHREVLKNTGEVEGRKIREADIAAIHRD